MKKVAFMFSILALGALTALAGTISVPQFNDGGGDTDSDTFPSNLSASWVSLKNNTASPQVYTLLYFGLDGSDRTPADSTFSIAGNAARGWRPVNTTDPNQGAGITIPSATAGSGAATCTILYNDPAPPSGRLLVNVAGKSSSYAFSLIP